MENWNEFFGAAAKMRTAQKRYFACRDWAQKQRRLNEARDLERRVDAAIKERAARLQGSLFEEEE
jgi:hypothetical protein